MYILGTVLTDDNIKYNKHKATGLWIEIKSPVNETVLNPENGDTRLTVSLDHKNGIVIHNNTDYKITLYKYGLCIPSKGVGEEILYINEKDLKKLLPHLTETIPEGVCGFISEEQITNQR